MSDGGELLALVRSADQQTAALFGQMISITFAMIAGIYYFLNRARIELKLFAFTCYGVGMLAFFGMMLRESNIKRIALEAIEAMPATQRSSVVEGLRELSQSWLFKDTSIFLNAAHYVLWISVIYLLFFWKRPNIIV
ncbi:hypothetical protein [Candidatus Viadribacter manganicus]|uniref:DUF4149 domain-containing protein n=1 Tax=Candidatus Viadribacter manganicus TaxID=1759059 RepID=A0A1B1AGL8_9PROT|nr:hypothetical protein [Candidatus Viadribacter manganicus]ANP45685.1 hypothetical protein ATE48_06995 [Candidatus Viadribacter manganicus]